MKNLYETYTKMNDVRINHNSTLPIMSVKYTEKATEWEKEPELMLARGIVIDTQGNVVAKPFTKFFNYHQLKNVNKYSAEFIQQHSNWPNSKIVSVTNKLDGGLAFLSTYNNQLMGFSGNSTESKFSSSFLSEVKNQLTPAKEQELTKFLTNKTLVFEYINESLVKHVIRYNHSGAYVIGLIDNTTFKETANYEALNEVASHYGFNLVQFLNLTTKDEVLNYINNVKNKEGVVVSFENGLKLKIKTPEYLKVIGLGGGLTTGTNKTIVKNLINNINSGAIDDLIPYLPSRTITIYNNLMSVINQYNNKKDLQSILTQISHKMTNVTHKNWIMVNEIVNSTIYKNTTLVMLIMNNYNNGTLNISRIMSQMYNPLNLEQNLINIASK